MPWHAIEKLDIRFNLTSVTLKPLGRLDFFLPKKLLDDNCDVCRSRAAAGVFPVQDQDQFRQQRSRRPAAAPAEDGAGEASLPDNTGGPAVLLLRHLHHLPQHLRHLPLPRLPPPLPQGTAEGSAPQTRVPVLPLQALQLDLHGEREDGVPQPVVRHDLHQRLSHHHGLRYQAAH